MENYDETRLGVCLVVKFHSIAFFACQNPGVIRILQAREYLGMEPWQLHIVTKETTHALGLQREQRILLTNTG